MAELLTQRPTLAREQNEDWLKVAIVRDSGSGFAGRLIGSRDRVRRIGD